MRLQGDANNLHGVEQDMHVYLLIKKLAFWESTTPSSSFTYTFGAFNQAGIHRSRVEAKKLLNGHHVIASDRGSLSNDWNIKSKEKAEDFQLGR